MELHFEKIFKIVNTAMTVSRSHPNIRKDKKWVLLFLIKHSLFSLVFIIVAYNIIFFNLKSKDFAKTCKNGTLSVVFMVVTFQFCIMLWKGKMLKSLIQTMKEDYAKVGNLDVEDQKVVLKYAERGIWVGKQWLGIAISAGGTFIVKNVANYIRNYIAGEFQYVPMYDLVYPFYIEERKDILGVYLATYALTLYYAFYAGFMYVSFVPLGPMFLLHACGRLEVLTFRMNKLHDGKKDVRLELRSIIVELQKIYK